MVPLICIFIQWNMVNRVAIVLVLTTGWFMNMPYVTKRDVLYFMKHLMFLSLYCAVHTNRKHTNNNCSLKIHLFFNTQCLGKNSQNSSWRLKNFQFDQTHSIDGMHLNKITRNKHALMFFDPIKWNFGRNKRLTLHICNRIWFSTLRFGPNKQLVQLFIFDCI